MTEEKLSNDELAKMAKEVLADGKVDFSEATRLLGFMTPSAASNERYHAFRQLLERVMADGVITDAESDEVAAALRELTAKRRVPWSVTVRL